MVQMVAGSILIVLGIYIFTTYPLKKDTKSLVLGALFVVLSVILKRLSFMIPIFGVPALKLGFEMIPMMLAGMVLAPSYGYMVGLAVDLVGLIIAPTEFPFLGFTLNSVLMVCIPAMVVEKTKHSREKTLAYLVFSLVGIVITFVSMYILSLDVVNVSGKEVTMTWFMKGIILLICLLCSILLWIVIRKMREKIHQENVRMLYIWIIAIILTEVSITFLLTPYWLQVMYEIPFMISLFVRVLKQCVMIPIDIMVGYQILKVLKKI